ncbi:hypothetical protein [Murimonas intestini]|uniref:Uncharacterized protein n=1 Tax=Murimonas intestini TaxID=1337051 RepID=A0AB73T199_9FIRM|nr:hypothetical protein [Murimonas intestini]MCR1840436.1 hypothetical protein [Murimonas intestini]MCR1867453.1 hypothetical protein [Murimonas intestini]MCR1884640.1 hypothetical protein [Murimonas intestini]
MHKKVIAARQKIKFRDNIPEGNAPYYMMEMVWAVASDLEKIPQFYIVGQEKTLWVFYEYTSFICDDFLEKYGVLSALISEKYPVSVCGTSGELEHVWAEAGFINGRKELELIKSSTSGRDFDEISNICLRFYIEDEGERDELCSCLANLDYRQDYLAVSRTLLAKKLFAGIAEDYPDTYYRYLPMSGGDMEFWNALSMNQKKMLWILFLEYKVSAVEFEYVVNALKDGSMVYLFTWELALRMALDELGISVESQEDDFKVLDKDGKRLRMDYGRGSEAEKLFLKILFPVIQEKQKEV